MTDPSTIRRQALEEALIELRLYHKAGGDEFWRGVKACRAAISALLPQPKDEAKDLIKEWLAQQNGGAYLPAIEGAEHFARWLLSQGWGPPE